MSEKGSWGQLIQGDALEVLRTLPDNSVDSICCDPPSSIKFMSKVWDSDKGGRVQWVAWLSSIMQEALRVLKPGGHALVWALPRTAHWTACAVEDAGFEIKDKVYFIFGTGFPKSLDISKAIDKIQGVEREVVGTYDSRSQYDRSTRTSSGRAKFIEHDTTYGSLPFTSPATPESVQYAGFGTSLKPACEEWILCRKPISEKNIAANILRWGVGGLNIDACRVGYASEADKANLSSASSFDGRHKYEAKHAMCDGNREHSSTIKQLTVHDKGRFPSHLLLSHTLLCNETQCSEDCPIRLLDEQSGRRKSGGGVKQPIDRGKSGLIYGAYNAPSKAVSWKPSEGGASRYFAQLPPDTFFYSSKASRKERNEGCEDLPAQKRNATNLDGAGKLAHRIGEDGTITPKAIPAPEGNHHVTVKPIALVRYLVRLITPPGGICLDMFAGSGTTGVACVQEGFRYILIEQEAEYIEIAKARIAHAEATYGRIEVKQ